jgi:hypothetical protein
LRKIHKGTIVLLLPAWCAAAVASTALAQAPGYADITRPNVGEALVGVITIEGSASHPSFLSYDLYFAYEAEGTETWFPILDNVQNPVVDGRLGIWDTTGITDGNYKLRLRVHLKDGNALEAIVSGLRLRNASPIETATPGPAVEAARDQPLSPTVTPLPTPSTSEDPQQRKTLTSLWLGAGFGLVALLFIGTYLSLRRNFLLRRSTRRMRHIHGRERRSGNQRRRLDS